MIVLVVRRLLFLLVVLLGISILTFVLAHMVPTDPARLLAGPHATPQQVAQIRHRYGLDRPLPLQYLTYIGGVAHGDLGVSLHTQWSVGADLSQFLPATIELSIAALLIAVALGIVLGTLAALRPHSWLDNAVTILPLTGAAMPAFWLGLLAQWLFYDVLGVFPAGGRLDPGVSSPPRVSRLYTIDSLLAGRLDLFASTLWHLALPAAVLAYGSLAVIARMVRGSLLEAMYQDYTRVARAKGLSRVTVVTRHALRNSLMPTITIVGLQSGYLLSGAILVETVFSWPGLGQYMAQSILAADYTPILGITLVIALIYVLLNTAVDVTYAAADPRVRYG